MKKRTERSFILTALLAVICSFTVVLNGCIFNKKEPTPVYVTSIEKTASNEEMDVYTVYYSDGTTSVLQIKNGKDGKDADAVTVNDLYNEYVNRYGNITYAEFLQIYFSFEQSEYSVVNSCLRSTAKVYSEFKERVTSSTQETNIYTGSAVIYKMDSDYTYFITNYHVVYDSAAIGSKISEKIYVYMYGSESYPVESGKNSNGSIVYDYGDYAIACDYIGGSVNYDIALIKAKTSVVQSISPSACAIEYATDYVVGETAIAIGNPNDAGVSVTQGIVSVDNEFIPLDIDGTMRTYRSIRIDTPLYHGNSGGGLFNTDGKLIGITNAGNESEQNINYAIPVQIVSRAVDNILYYYNDGNSLTNGLYKITLGVTVQAQNSRFEYDAKLGYGKIVEDITVLEVAENSITEKLKLAANDVITAIIIDGEKISLNRYFEIGDCLLEIRENTVINIEYVREGKTYTTSNYIVKNSDLKLA